MNHTVYTSSCWFFLYLHFWVVDYQPIYCVYVVLHTTNAQSYISKSKIQFADDAAAFKSRKVGAVSVRNSAASYAIVYGDPRGNFRIDGNTGNIATVRKVDRELQSSYTLNVVARHGLSYGNVTVKISVADLNDHQPDFVRAKDEISLDENAAVGQEVYFARARDLDAGENGRISYELSYNPGEVFRIATATGALYLNRPISAEPGSEMVVAISATDSGLPRLSSGMRLRITVADVNDHTPAFDHTSYETSLSELTKVNERFFAVAASDPDLADNGRISYTISDGDAEGVFGIFPDGFLFLRKALDRENRDYYALEVTATDLGECARSSTVPVVVHVVDENDNAPNFTNETFAMEVGENQPVGTFVGKLTATDKDIGELHVLCLPALQQQQECFIEILIFVILKKRKKSEIIFQGGVQTVN